MSALRAVRWSIRPVPRVFTKRHDLLANQFGAFDAAELIGQVD